MVVKKILLSLLFLFCISSLSYGKPHNKLIEARKARLSRVVKSKASPRKKTTISSRLRPKVQPRKKAPRSKKQSTSRKRISIPRKRISVSLTKKSAQQKIRVAKKVSPKKKVVERKKQSILNKRTSIPLKKESVQQKIINQQTFEATLKSQERKRIVQQQLQEAELKRQENARITQKRAYEEKLRQQEQYRLQQEILAAQQRQRQAEDAHRKEQERLQAIAAQQRQRQAEVNHAEIQWGVHPNNFNSYKTLGLTEFFEQGYYGKNTTVAVIEGGFYHTLAPNDRPHTNGINIPGVRNNDWYEQHHQQILPPLSFYDPVVSPVDQRFEANLGRGKDFRFSHGDKVLSAIAQASPQAKILPVQASFGRTDGSFVRALEALSQRDDVNIINMSRWLESCAHDETQLNPNILTALRKCTDRGKIIVLSACNRPHLIPTIPGIHNDVKDINDFGANLISDLFYNMLPNDSLKKHVVISGALDNVTNAIAYYSMRAGNGQAAENYIATHGNIYSKIEEGLWGGTSASAPYTSAILANLMSIRPGIQSSKVVEALFEKAELRLLEKQTYGRGILNGQRTLQAIRDDV